MTQKHNSKDRQGKSRWYVRLFRWYVANGPFAPYPELPSREHLESRLEIDKNAPGRWAWSVRKWQQDLTEWGVGVCFEQIAAATIAAGLAVLPLLFVMALGLNLIPSHSLIAAGGRPTSDLLMCVALILPSCSLVKLTCVFPSAFANLPGLADRAWVGRFLKAQTFCIRLRYPAQLIVAIVIIVTFDWNNWQI